MLRIENLHMHYENNHVLHGVSLEVAKAETIAVLGRNGSGKTTLLKGILGLTPITAGRIQLDDVNIVGLTPDFIAHLGVAYVPKEHQVFPRLTVMENLRIASMQRNASKDLIPGVLEKFPEFKPRLHQVAGTLSGGEQQLLAIVRALLTQPRLLLMDEPAEGMMPSLVEKIEATIRTLNVEGVSV
ncbi:MAG: ABC transporter ATP-binding protein, partial [Candidatus Bathyarchaeia archaeon]